MKYSFLREETVGIRKQLIFTGSECKIFIPQYFFESEFAEIVGENCSTLGIYWFQVDGKFYEQQFPLRLEFSFSEQYSNKGFKLAPTIPALDYQVFVLKNGDAFLCDTSKEQTSKELQWFIAKLIEGGKIPPYVPYSDALSLLNNALIATGINGKLGVTSVNYEFLLSELYRDKNDNSREFRFAFNGQNENDYKLVRITKVPELVSTYVSITGEDLTNQLINSVSRTRDGKEERESPLEKLLKY